MERQCNKHNSPIFFVFFLLKKGKEEGEEDRYKLRDEKENNYRRSKLDGRNGIKRMATEGECGVSVHFVGVVLHMA